jgi:hypothetical protein
MSRDRQAVTVCNEMPAPGAGKSRVPRAAVPVDRSRHGERHRGIVITAQGLRSSLSIGPYPSGAPSVFITKDATCSQIITTAPDRE